MKREDAGDVLAYLNAGFPRDALEPESAMVWIREIEELPSYTAALNAAKTIVRNGDRLPTIKEFREAYRIERDRMPRPPELDIVIAPPSPEAHEMLARIAAEDVLRPVDNIQIPATTSMPPRPVWARYLQRQRLDCLMPPTDEEKHDAILVLRDLAPREGEDTWPVGLVGEAQRILDEASAA